MKEVNHIRRVMAEYIGLYQGNRDYYSKGNIVEYIRIESWLPDQNAIQLDMVEEKATEEELIFTGTWTKDVAGNYTYNYGVSTTATNKIKHLARFHALSQLIEKEKPK